MLVVALALVLQVAVLRVRGRARSLRERRFMAVWQPLIAAAAGGETVELPPLMKGEELFFLKAWNQAQASAAGEAKARCAALAARCDILAYTHALLSQSGLHPRLIALLTLGNLGDRSAWNDILRLSREPDALVSLAAARALLQIDPDAAIHELMPQLQQREDWQMAQFAHLVEEYGTHGVFAYLADAASRLSGSTDAPYLPQLRRVLRLLQGAPSRYAVPAARRVLAETMDEEVVAACLKLLRGAADLPAVRSRIGHASWIVRLQAARALGRMGGAEDVPHLASLLGDPVWWVRYRAAQALGALTRDDRGALSQLRGTLHDRYACEMLDMVMAEQGAR